jgi:hypothetical protein
MYVFLREGSKPKRGGGKNGWRPIEIFFNDENIVQSDLVKGRKFTVRKKTGYPIESLLMQKVLIMYDLQCKRKVGIMDTVKKGLRFSRPQPGCHYNQTLSGWE